MSVPENAVARAEALRGRRRELTESIQGIEAQLSDKGKLDSETGLRMADHEYHDWRVKAVIARKHKLNELRDVNEALKAVNNEMFAAEREVHESRMERIERKLDLLLTHFSIPTE